jgi:hypothetical protein
MAKSGSPLPPGAVPPGQGELIPDDQDLAPGLSFWQLPWVQNVLPFITSLAFHAGVIIIGGILLAVTTVVTSKSQEQTLIPESTMADNGPPGGVPNVGTAGDPLKQAMQDKVPDAGTNEGWANKAGPLDAAVAADGREGAADASGIIAQGMGGLAGGGGASGGGSGDGGPLARFGTPGGGAIGPHGPVFGHGGNARKIAFVCDASGSMISKFASLKNQLTNAIEGLKAIQSFSVIFFQDNNALALDKDSLVIANQDNKRKAYSFLDNVTTSSTSDPMPGIRMAFKQAPELVYLLTDGDFPDNKLVLAEIRKLNSSHKVHINTIAFVNEKDTETDFKDLLQTIAKENGGTYKLVNEQDLSN